MPLPFNLGRGLSALGQAFGGYAMDEEAKRQRQRTAALDAQNAQDSMMRNQVSQAQLGDIAAQAQQRKAQADALAVKGQSNQRAFGALQRYAPGHATIADGYDEGTDYASLLKDIQQEGGRRTLELGKQQAAYNTLRAEYPKAVLSGQPFNRDNPADYVAALADARDLRKLQAGQSKQHWVSAGVDKDGQPVILNAETGETRTGGGLKAGAAAGQERAGMAAAFLSRLKMGKADFDNGMGFIRGFHQKLAGENTITPLKMAEQAAANIAPNPEAHGMMGILNNATGAATSGFANQRLAKDDPDDQRYVNLLNSMSLAMTEVLPRPTQQILGIEKGINTVKAGDPPERIADIQHRLDKAYEYLFSDPEGMLRKGPTTQSAPVVHGAGPRAAGNALSAKDAAQAARDPKFAAWLRTQGYTVP